MRLVLALIGLALLSRSAVADCPSTGKTLPIARGSIDVDGRLDDATWQTACFIGDFTQKQPRYLAAPAHPVKVAVAIDDRTLYIGARMWAAGPDDISDALTQRDDTSQAERFIVSIDPSNTRRLAYSFAVTARGVRADWIHTDDAEFTRDMSWNPVWIARAELLADGWTAELAIPLSQLRLPRTPQASWGINFNWYIPHRQEDVFWISVPPDQTAWASQFGKLSELPPIAGGLGLEILPYAATRLVLDEDPSESGNHRLLAGLEAGVDVKLRPLPGLTVTATINPDFGQVEVDPAFVNLTAYEVLLPERRPFFVENQALFANAGGKYFYSRRIGASGARILGALAAGGYVASDTQLAILGAVTGENEVDTGRVKEIVAPLTAWSAARVEHQIGASVVGATATGVARALDDTGLVLPTSALVGGGDARLRTEDRAYQLDLFGGASSVFGTAAAIDRVQQSSTHYFQRPGQSYLELAPRTSLVGWHGFASLAKRAGMWQGNAAVNAESPGYERNDLGVLASADDIEASIDIQRIVTKPTERVFSWQVGAGAYTAWNFGGDRRPIDLQATAGMVTQRFWEIEGNARWSSPGLVDDLTRGGPSMRIGWSSGASLSASTPRGTSRQLTANLSADVSPTLQQGVTASLSLAARITPALRLDLVPSFTTVETQRQYVTTLDDNPDPGTFDKRYLFGHLRRTEAALELRTTWSLSPDLVLTLYAQPFISVGRYPRIGQLVAARDDEVRWFDETFYSGDQRTIPDAGTVLSIPEPDFRVASLRSTAVLRWELAPGSTLFIVWQQLRGGVPLLPAQSIRSTTPELFTQPAIHTIAIKLSYWFG